MGPMLENSNQSKGIESGRDARELKTKEAVERVQISKERVMPQSMASIPCQKPTTTHKVKVIKIDILQTFFLEKKPSSLIHNIQYPPTTDRGYAYVCTSEAQISQ